MKTKWSDRTVIYLYDKYGRLTRANLPEFSGGPGVPGTYSYTGSKRPAIAYSYESVAEPSPSEPLSSPVYTDFAELSGNLKSIKDPRRRSGARRSDRSAHRRSARRDAGAFLPIVDTAATGSLHATLDSEGKLVERVLYADAYGDAPRYLQGAVVERATVTVNNGARTLRIALSEAIDASTLGSSIRLTALASGVALRSSTLTATLEGDCTLKVAIDAALLEGADSLEIGVASSLRFTAWGNRPMQAVSAWEQTLGIASASTDFPFIRVASISELDGTLYDLPDLYLAGRTDSIAKLHFSFHALPFHDPASGFTFVRARWYDAATASFLTPDPMGYADASALYAYAGSDPVNFRDPTGMEAEGAEEEDDGGWIKKARLAASIGLGMVPVLGDALDVVQVVTGHDFIAGEKLSAAERAITAAAMVIPGVSAAALRKTLGAAGDLAKHADEGAALAKNSDEVAAIGKNTDEFAAAAAHRADDVGTNASQAASRADTADDGMKGLTRGGSPGRSPDLPPPSLSKRGYQPVAGERSVTRAEWKAQHRAERVAKGGGPSWSKTRSDYWKEVADRELASPSGAYSRRNIIRMMEGRAPRVRVEVLVRKTGRNVTRDVSLELHHRALPQRIRSSTASQSWNLEKATPWGHEAMDPFRHTGYELIRVIRGTSTF